MDCMKTFLANIFLAAVLICSYCADAAAVSPFLSNYETRKYGASNQNWSLAQDKNGYIYAGNDYCLLRFNGKSWEKLYPFGEEKDIIIRSLYADKSSDRVYIGAYREFGYFVTAADGSLEYTSLSRQFQDKQAENDQIWYISRVKDKIFFIYFSSYYIYDIPSGEVTIHYAPTSYYYTLDSCLYLAQRSGKIRKYDGLSTEYSEVPPDNLPGTAMKVFRTSSGRRAAICEKEGMYIFGNDWYRRVDRLGDRWGTANRAIQCSDGTIIVGFRGSGIYAFSEKGETLWHLDTESGLLNNTVHNILEDDCGNIWVALAKGISVIFKEGDSIIRTDSPYPEEITSSYVSDDILYIGTKRGLSYTRLDNYGGASGRIKKLSPEKQVWNISEIMGEILVSDDENTYRVEGDEYTVLSNAPGGTGLRLITGSDGRLYLIQGSFTLLYIYEKDRQGKWVFRNTVDGFLKPVLNIEVDHLGNIWLEHMYDGIFRVKLSEDLMTATYVEHFGDRKRHICKIGGRVLFHDRSGFSWYDDMSGQFKKYDSLNASLGEFIDCDKVIPAASGKYWMVKDDRAVLVKAYDGTADIIDYINCAKYGMSMTKPFHTISTWNKDRYLVGTELGFLIHSVNTENMDDSLSRHPQILIRKIVSEKDSLETRYDISAERLTVPNKCDLSIYTAIVGEQVPNHIRIESMLDGYDYSIRTVDDDMVVSYHRLPAGNYSLHLTASDATGKKIAYKELIIYVSPPLLASAPFIAVYTLLLAALCMLAIFFVKKLLEKQRITMARKNEEVMEQARLKHEKDLMSIRNEQLEESVLLKSKELATYSLIEAQRNTVLKHLSEELTNIYYQEQPGIRKRDFERLMGIIREGEFTEDNWNHFFSNFDLIHKFFFRSLKAMHEDLTSNDLRLCAYLRLNMSTKEIANIMGITVKSAEMAKYRLRKKLKVDSAVPLHSYLMSLSSPIKSVDPQ